MSFRIADAPKEQVHGALLLTPKPEYIDEIGAELSQLADKIEATEPGTLVFSISKAAPAPESGSDGPTTILVNITFKDQATADAHRASPELQAFIAKGKTDTRLASPPEGRVLFPVGGFLRKPPQ